jgi:hypothetical protein
VLVVMVSSSESVCLIQDSGYRIQDSGYGIQDSGFRIHGTGFGMALCDRGIRALEPLAIVVAPQERRPPDARPPLCRPEAGGPTRIPRQ